MRPIILSITPAGNGLAVAVVSVAPGRRVNVMIPDPALFGPPDRATIESLATLTDRKGTP